MQSRRWLPVVLWALLATLWAPAYAEEPTDPQQSATLTLSAPNSVRLTTSFQLTAQSTPAPATPGTGTADALSVALQRAEGTGSWATVATAATDATGKVVFTQVANSASATYRAVIPATDTEPEVVSNSHTVTGYRVASSLRLTAANWWVIDERSRTLTATWRAAGRAVSGRVTLWRRPGAGAWRRVATKPTYADGIVRFVVRPRRDMHYLVTGPQGPWWLAGRSADRFLDNRPPAPPVRYPADAPRPTPLAAQPRATGAGANAQVSRIPDRVWRSMVGRSWHPGCPVGRSALRLIRINYWGFDGYRYRGEIVVNAAIVGKTVGALRGMYAGKYPLRRLYRVDRFGWSNTLRGANDYASMARDNTSAFNCRGVVGNPSVLSPHSRGRAIDVNPWENPYASRRGIVPNTYWYLRSAPRIAWTSSSHPVLRIWLRHGFRWTYGNTDGHHVDGRRMPVVQGTMIG